MAYMLTDTHLNNAMRQHVQYQDPGTRHLVQTGNFHANHSGLLIRPEYGAAT